MDRGRGSSRGGGGYRGVRGSGGRNKSSPATRWAPRSAVGAGAHLDNSSSGTESSKVGKSSEKASLDGVTKKFDDLSSSDFPSEPNSESQHSFNIPPNDGSFKGVWNIPETEPKPSRVADIDPALPISSGLSERKKSFSPSHFIPTSPVTISCQLSLTISCQLSPEVQSGNQTSEGTSGKNKLDSSDLQHNRFSFDICEERSSSGVRLKTPLHTKNRAMRKEKLRAEGDNIKIIRPGMILLKGHISLNDQVKMVKSCRDLGRGPGGFYQPGYGDGAKLHLKMMCLGKNWDPETSKYGDTRPIDQAKPPPIPEDFQQLVKDVVLKCHRHLELENKITNARKILPPMSPNICIINFYTRSGKLGLHKDKDESQESLKKGLPVVSVSLGDTAEFLFGDDGDVDKAEKVELESGDVLIFGGESRHIFHGVSKIVEKTAPELLLEETRLKPGRVNLTFREY